MRPSSSNTSSYMRRAYRSPARGAFTCESYFIRLLAVVGVMTVVVCILGLRRDMTPPPPEEVDIFRRLMSSTGERGSVLVCGDKGVGRVYYYPFSWICRFSPCTAAMAARDPLVYSLTTTVSNEDDVLGIHATRVPFGAGGGTAWEYLEAILGDEFPLSFIRGGRGRTKNKRAATTNEVPRYAGGQSMSLLGSVSFPGWYVFDERPNHLQDLLGTLISQDRYTCSAFIASDYTRFNSQVEEMLSKYPWLVLMGASPQVGQGGVFASNRLLPIPASAGYSGARRWPRGITAEEWAARHAQVVGGGGGEQQQQSSAMWLVRWRGVTTGQGSIMETSIPPCGSLTYPRSTPYDFESSDRFKTIQGLSTIPGMDLKFSKPVQGVSKSKHIAYYGGHVSAEEMISTSLFMIDIDGNTNAWSSLRWKLCSGLPLFRVDSSFGFVEWFHQYLINGSNVLLLSPMDPAGDVQRWLEQGNATFFADVARRGAEFCDEYLAGERQMDHLDTMVHNVWATLSTGQSWMPKNRRIGNDCWVE